MKVNITGRGVIPGLATIPPVYGKDLSEAEITRILNFPNLRVYAASSGAIITKNNVKNFFHLSVEDIIKKASKLGIKTTVEEEKETNTPDETVEETPTTDVVENEPVGDETVDTTEEDELNETPVEEDDDESTHEETNVETTENRYSGQPNQNNQNRYNGNKKKNKRH